MFRSTATFDKLLEKATSQFLMEPEWPSILQICDLIRQNDVQPRYALGALKKKMTSTNPHTALYAFLVLESMMKNCGPSVHDEVTTKPFLDFIYDTLRTTTHENVKNKILELIQVWNHAFRKSTKHQFLKDTMSQMKADGFKFPTLCESDAMFSADTAPEWTDGDVCHRCRVPFSFIQRKHHCRACGQVFCGQCTSKTTTLPKYGIEKEVRVCDACYDQANKPSQSKPAEKETDLPPEYLKSSLAQQNQEPPPRKSEDELREEEELALALALSQSEAEAKEKEKKKMSSYYSSYNKEPQQQSKQPEPVQQPQEEQNPELARYLNRSYWESLHLNENDKSAPISNSPSAPAVMATGINDSKKFKENGVVDIDLEEFMNNLKSHVEIFVNRMKSNSSRGRPIANDSTVQTLFMNITTMHSQLLRYIQEHDDSRLHFEAIQDKLTQIKDAREALDALREEHREKLRREAEEAERQRQMQMAHKLEIMRKKKQEYLQYQRQLALQRIQEQEREMQMRQEQQKQQYLMGQFGATAAGYISSPVHQGQFMQGGYYGSYGPPQMMGNPQPPPPSSQGMMQQTMPPQAGAHYPNNQFAPPNNPNPPSTAPHLPGPMPGGMMPAPPSGIPQSPPNQFQSLPQQPQVTQQPQQQQIPPQQPNSAIAAPPTSPQQNGEAQTAELISFD